MKKTVNLLYILLLIIIGTFLSIKPVKAYVESNMLKVTNRNFTNFSTDKNFIIFVVDAVDSKKFDKELSKSKYKNDFKDFTYYPDTLSHYMFTRESVPLILAGAANYNETDFLTFYNKAFDNSKFLNRLIDEEYDINMYEYELNWTTKKARIVQNIVFLSNEENEFIYTAKCTLNRIGNKYLPFIFNIFPSLRYLNCNNTFEDLKEEEIYSWDNIANYNYIMNMPVTLTDKKQFKYLHTNGVHPPYNTSPELKKVSESNSSESKEMQASIKLLDSYINMLKTNNVYDNSIIILIADHGYNNGKVMGKQNPILYIKGFNEVNTSLNVSNKKVSHLDLPDAYQELLNGKQAKELFLNIPDNRVRKLIWYEFRKENHMVEYELNGHAWETSKLKKTGKKFNR